MKVAANVANLISFHIVFSINLSVQKEDYRIVKNVNLQMMNFNAELAKNPIS